MFEFKPGDVIVYKLGKGDWGILRPLVRWLLGSPYYHVGLFFAYTKRGLPLTIESVGRGVMIRSLLSHQGRDVKVMRWDTFYLSSGGYDFEEVGLKVAKAAERIADSSQSFYDYLCITQFVLPRLILEKLHLPMPLKWHRNPFYICSELTYQAYENAGYRLDYPPLGVVPLPGDFTQCRLLEKVWEGALGGTLLASTIVDLSTGLPIK